MIEITFKILVTIISILILGGVLYKTWTSHIDVLASLEKLFNKSIENPTDWMATRDSRTLYDLKGSIIGKIEQEPLMKENSQFYFPLIYEVNGIQAGTVFTLARKKYKVLSHGLFSGIFSAPTYDGNGFRDISYKSVLLEVIAGQLE